MGQNQTWWHVSWSLSGGGTGGEVCPLRLYLVADGNQSKDKERNRRTITSTKGRQSEDKNTHLGCEFWLLLFLPQSGILSKTSTNSVWPSGIGLVAGRRTSNSKVEGFNSIPPVPLSGKLTTLGKLSRTCACHQAVEIGTGRWAVAPYGWEGNRRSDVRDVALATHRRLVWLKAKEGRRPPRQQPTND